ncbi:MAG: hypothetical protein K8R58_02065 [Bacteroidales bacterium]|nr:hypothetical protein [Bacteroidales bacterium]
MAKIENSKIKKCNLCQQEKKLITKSHIIPEFFYREAGVYNEKHYMYKIETQRYLRTGEVSYVPTGEYESEILCEDCDNNRIGELETYGSKVLYGGLSPEKNIKFTNYRNPFDGFEYTIFENVDYKQFKLFLLSLLWRAAISKRKTFKEAQISIKNEEKLRKMIFTRDAGEINNFPIVILSYLRDNAAPTDLIAQPIKSSTIDKDLITMMLAGFVFVFNITNNYKEISEIKDVTITPEGKFTVLHIPKGKTLNFILKYANLK